MPITHHAGGTTLTGDSIEFFRLCAVRGAVNLETFRLRSRGGAQWKRAHAYYGLTCKKTAMHVLLALDALVQERAKQVHISE